MATAFITGAGIRIGSAVARALGQAGYDLALHAHRSLGPLETLAEEMRALGRHVTLYAADLSDPPAVDALGARRRARTTRPWTSWCTTPASTSTCPSSPSPASSTGTMMGVNLEAPFFLTQALLPLLRAATGAAGGAHHRHRRASAR